MANLSIQTGTITDTCTIVTTLSSIKEFVIYRDSKTSAGLLLGHYTVNLGSHCTYCSSHSSTVSFISHGSYSPTVDGGTFIWPGEIGTDSYALASGVQYTWIAVGEV